MARSAVCVMLALLAWNMTARVSARAASVVLFLEGEGDAEAALAVRIHGQLSDLPVQLRCVGCQTSLGTTADPSLEGAVQVRLSLDSAPSGAWVGLSFEPDSGRESIAELMFLPLSDRGQATSSALETAALVVRLAMQAVLYDEHISEAQRPAGNKHAASVDGTWNAAIALGSTWTFDGTGQTGRLSAKVGFEFNIDRASVAVFLSAGASTAERDALATHRVARHAAGISLDYSVLKLGPISVLTRAGLATFVYQRRSDSTNALFTPRGSQWSPALALLPGFGLQWQGAVFVIRMCIGLEVLPSPPRFSYSGALSTQPFVIPRVAPSLGLTLLGRIP